MSLKFEWLGVVALWKIYRQREKKTSPRMLSTPYGCLLSVCWAFANPPALPGKIIKEGIIKRMQESLLFPHMTDGTCPARLGRFIQDFLKVFCIAYEIVIIYCCRFFSEAIQAKTSLPPFTVASSTSKHWTVNRENYLSILIMHCRFYIQFIVSVCVNECVTFENAAGNVLSVGRKVVMLNSYGSVGVNRKD